MKPRIVFVDDESAVLRGLQRSLWEYEDVWDLEFCELGHTALKAIVREAPDVIITDHNMPGMTGIELLSFIRENPIWDNVQVIFLTGNNDQSLKRRAIELGANDLLNKPLDTDDLVVRIRSCLLLKSTQDELRVHNQKLEEKVVERTRQLESAQFEIVYRLAKACELRDPETGYHTLRVAYCSRILARKLGKDQQYQLLLFLASMLHDIGKLGIPDNILLKPGKLTEQEYSEMQQHTSIGSQLLTSELDLPPDIRQEFGIDTLQSSEFIRLAAVVAEQHHEKFDGSGHPKGLSGDDIDIAARIVAVADVYDALRSRRPYKDANSEDAAIAILEADSGKHFDPRVLNAFFACQPEIRMLYHALHETEHRLAA